MTAPDTGYPGSNGCLKCWIAFRRPDLTPEQTDGWRQTFSGLHDCPALRLAPVWVIHCYCYGTKNSKWMETKAGHQMWNLQIVYWIICIDKQAKLPSRPQSALSVDKHSKLRMSTSRRARYQLKDVKSPYPHPLRGQFVGLGTQGGLVIFHLPEWSSC